MYSEAAMREARGRPKGTLTEELRETGLAITASTAAMLWPLFHNFLPCSCEGLDHY